jgi:hypothetical protein
MNNENSVVVNYKFAVFLYSFVVYALILLILSITCLLKADTTALKILSILGILFSFPISFLTTKLYIKNPFDKTIFNPCGIEYINKKISIFFRWDYVKELEVKYEKGGWWNDSHYVFVIIDSRGNAIQIELIYGVSKGLLKNLKNSFTAFCPREDLIQRVEEVLDKTYIRMLTKRKKSDMND